MKKILVAFFCCAVVISAIGQQNTKVAQIESTLNDILESTKAAGYAVAVVKGDKVIYAKGFGYKDYENKKKVDANTLFAIGSTSKAFTTALLGIMREEKGLDFEENPRTYLPQLDFYNDELNNNLTIKDIISHRTGLPRHDMSWYLFPTEDKDSLLRRVKHHEPFASIRETWYYNNFMYLTQGLITEQLTGKSWEDNVRERYFKPLDMKRSNLTIAELQEDKNISIGYDLIDFETIKPMTYFNIAAISPAGSINSSVNEMANWLKVWLNEGKYNGKQVLPAAYVKEAVNPLMLVGNGIADPAFPGQHLNSYGYAWFTSSYKGHYRLEHGGNIDGFSANVSFFPTDDIGIVVLANQNGSAVPTLVRNAIADHVLGLEKTDWVEYWDMKVAAQKLNSSTTKAKEEEGRVKGTQPSHSLLEYTGKYNHPGYGDFTITLKNDSLWAQFPVLKMYLGHWHYDVFKPYVVEDGKVDSTGGVSFNFNFKANDLGDIDLVHLKLEPTLDALPFDRTPLQLEIDNESLGQFVGEYLLSGATLKVHLGDDKNLKLNVPQQPEYTLLPVKENEFSIKGLSGYKAKFSDASGEMELNLIQPNGTFTAKKK